MKLSKKIDSVDQTLNVFIQDSSSATGAGLAGLVFNSSGLTCYYVRPAAASAQLTLATQTTTGAHSDGGFVEIDATNMTGWYRLDLSDAILASGVDSVGIHLQGATNMAPLPIEIQLDESDLGEINTSIGNIGSASGGSLNFSNEADNVDSAIKSVSFVGVETSGTNASVNADDGTYHNITHSGNAIDIVYQFDIGGGRSAASVSFKGYLNSGNDVINVQAYNGSTWDTRKIITGQAGTTNISEDIPLLSTHTGTGADLGKVFIRLETTAQTSPDLFTDELLVQAVSIGQSVGYANGSVWVDTSLSNTNTENFVDGVADNPVSTIAAALTIAASVGLKRITFAAGSTITLAATMDSYELLGKEWTLALGGQSVDKTFVSGATVSGTFTGDPIFENCVINSITGPNASLSNCGLGATITADAAGDWFLHECFSRVAGTGTPVFDFGAAVANTNLNVRAYSGGLEIQNIGGTGTDNMSLEGHGQLIFNANCAGGTVAIRGNFTITDNAGGAVTVSDNARFDIAQVSNRVKKNTALSEFEFLMVEASDHTTGKTGLSITSTRSIDGGAFAATANSASEVSNGIYKIDLAASDLNGDVITFRFTGTDADDRFITIVTQPT